MLGLSELGPRPPSGTNPIGGPPAPGPHAPIPGPPGPHPPIPAPIGAPPLQFGQPAWLTPIAPAWRTGIMLGICRDGIGMLFRCCRMLFMPMLLLRALLFDIIICRCWLGIEPG